MNPVNKFIYLFTLIGLLEVVTFTEPFLQSLRIKAFIALFMKSFECLST